MDSPLVLDVLSEVGGPKDAAGIRDAIQEVKEDHGYLLRARGWLAICRLTSALAD